MVIKNLKLGNMRKAQEWVIYPMKSEDTTAIIQCDNRIAKIDLETQQALLSSGKGGHQGFIMLNESLGAKVVPCPPEVVQQLKEFRAKKAEPITLSNLGK
jgi:hypothetical protein